MISIIACDNQNEKLGSYFEECAIECLYFLEDCLPSLTKPDFLKDSYLCQARVDLLLGDYKRGDTPFIFAAYSHGYVNSLISQQSVYVRNDLNTHLFKGGLVYTNACLTAQELGPNLILNGTLAFVGYDDEVIVPIRNKRVKDICKTADNYALAAFLTGIEIGVAVQYAKNYLTRQILNFKELKIGAFLAGDLIKIRNSMQVLGNKKLLITDLYLTKKKQNLRKQRIGIVISNKMEKSIVVSVERLGRHSKYSKRVKQSKKYIVHDEENSCNIGDKVQIMETRPLSKYKHWRLVVILKRAK